MRKNAKLQRTAAYIAYDLGSRYFHNHELRNHMEATKLRLAYAETRKERQDGISFVFCNLFETFFEARLSEFSTYACVVSFRSSGKSYDIIFDTGFYRAIVRINEYGRYSFGYTESHL